MRTVHSLATLAMLAMLATPSARMAAQAPTLTWGPAPAVFPAGAKMAVLQGDPGKPESFTVRLDMPDGYRVAPHFHPTDEHITIIQGSLLLGMGDKVDPARTTTLPAGAFASALANMHHYVTAKGHTVVQVQAMGPFMLTYVDKADDPSDKARTAAH
jgi:quercetin dioxygenase-like cupin family protein